MDSASSHACPIDPEELANAFALISRVVSGEDDFDPTRYTMNYLTVEGQVSQVQFEDSPLNRIMLALREWCHEEPAEKYASLCWRLFALNELIHQGHLSEWVKVDGQAEFFSIPGIIIRVAATLPLENGKGFGTEEFVNTVRKMLS